MQYLQSRVPNFNEEKMKAFLQGKLDATKDFKEEIITDLMIIKSSIDNVRDKLKEQQNSPDNVGGLIKGEIDEYLASYGDQITKAAKRFDQDIAFW